MSRLSRAPLSIDAAPAKGATTRALAAPANDNGGAKTPAVSCDLPVALGILPGEAALIARFLGRLLSIAANDNGEER